MHKQLNVYMCMTTFVICTSGVSVLDLKLQEFVQCLKEKHKKLNIDYGLFVILLS